jgi:hypothetical protein
MSFSPSFLLPVAFFSADARPSLKTVAIDLYFSDADN